MSFHPLAVRRRPNGWREGVRPAVRRWGGVLLLAILPCAGFAARPWPDTRQRIVAFSDQLPNSLNATQRWFAATHFAGCQKILRSEIQALRTYNTNFLCLHYQLAVGAGPANFIIGDAWGSDWAYVNAQSNWFLRNAGTQRVHQTQWNWDLMDVRYTNGAAVSGFPAYWISNCLARIAAAEDDGVFADSYTPDAYGFGQSNPTHPWLEDVDLCRANWVPALEQFGRAARAALASNDFVFLPNLGGLVTGWLDMDYGVGHGGMIEGFAFWGPGDYFDPADWALQMDRALALARSNKIVICQAYPGEGSAQERMFATTSYLLVKGSKTYLNLLATSDVALEYYPEYEINLGGATGALPAGAATLWNAAWGVYRRDYSNGIVLVNPSASAVNIASLGTNYWRVTASGGGVVNTSGGYGGTLATALVSSLNLPARSGAVLLQPARTLTVAPAGGDFTTIQAALNAAQAGDTIDVRAGVYNEKLVVPRGGSAASGFTTLRAHAGEAAILDGTGRAGADMILLNEISHFRIQGLEIRNNTGVTDGSGIRLLGACRNIEILDNTIHALRGTNAMGITVYGTNSAPASNLLIRANHIYDCDAAPSEALTLNGNIVDFEVSSNRVHDINNIGIVFIGGETDISPYGVCRRGVCRGNEAYRCRASYGGGYAAGIYVDGGQDIVVERNRIYECDLGLEVGCENAGFAATGVVVRANLIWNNDKAGLVFGGYEAARGRVNVCQFLNNTCYRNDTLQDGNGELWIQYGSNNVVRNNIFYCGPQNLGLADAGATANRGNTLDYNLWFSSAGSSGSVGFDWRGTSYTGFAAFQAGSGQDAHSSFANPQFADGSVAAFDGHLLTNSPAINAGDPAYLPPADVRDADGNPRVYGARADVGAYEWQGGAPGTGPPQPANLWAFHRSGQTFLTWSERADLAGESYRIYRHAQPITTGNLASATRLYQVWEGSADFPANRYADSAFQARYFDRVVITNRGAPLPAGTGLLVWTLATNDFGGGATGTAYYAVTTVNSAGTENRTNFTAENALGPLGEGVAEPLPVETAQNVGPRGHLFLQFMDLRKWNPTFHAPNPGNGYYGLDSDSPAVQHALAYAYDYVVFEPDCGSNPAPVTVSLHGWGGNTYGPVTEDPDPWGWCTYRIYPVDQGETWWFGFARDHDFRTGGEVAAGDVIVNYTEQRVLRMLRDLQRQPPGPPVDTNRVYVYGQSMGGSGTLALALRYPNVFAAAFASQPMTDYSTSGDGGGIDWRDDAAAKWGSRALNLPVQLDAPAGWAAPIQSRSGTGVWTWQNHRLNTTNRMGDENVPFGLTHGTNDDVVEWATQGRPVYGPLDASRRCWGGLVSDADHTWIGFEGLPPGLAPVDYAPFANFRVVRNETVPGLSRDSGDLASPPTRTGGYHLNLDWSASWNTWDGVPQDTATNWQMGLRAVDGRTHTVDVTPRRTQRFHPAPGAEANWRNLRVSDGVQVQSGTATVDAFGLVTASNITVSTTGNRVRFEVAGGASTGRVFYVATNGNNAAAGSSAQPWRTPGFASRQLAPGDTLIIRGGRYLQSVFDADIVVPASGRADAWITIRGEEGNRPVLAGRSNLYASIILGGRSFVRLENLEITHDPNAVGAAGYFREGLNILGAPASTNLVLNNLYIHHLDEFGLDAQDVDGLTVTNCRIEYCGFGAIGGPAGAAGGLRNLSIRNSRLAYSGHYYQGGDGATRPYDRPDGFGIEASAGPVEIVDTVAEHNYGDGLDSKAARTTIRRCIVANNSCDGVKLWDGGSRVENTLIYGRGDGDATPTPWSLVVIANPAPSDPRFEFVNVTVADQHSGNYLLHAQYDYPAVPLDLVFRNCIFQSVDSPIYIGSASSLAADHNLFHAPGRLAEVLQHGATTYGSNNIAALGTGNLYGDPLFRAPAWGVTGDYQLRSNSPAINLGTATGAPADDLNRQLRSPPPDAGAYEWASAPVAVFTACRINCGGGATGEWVADTGYSGGTAKSTTSAIADATDAPQAVYQTRRYAPTLTYRFPDVPDGTYTIRLHFAELYYNAAGRRVFDVSIEDQARLTNFDIFQAAGGKNRAVVRTFENVVVSGGLQIQGVASADSAQFSGIEIESAGPAVPAVVASSSAITVPEGSTASFGVHLDTAPAGTVTVTVTRASGDANISITGGASLVFTAANYAIDQTVTLAAAEDADTTGGTAAIQCTASGYTAASVTATEQDNDAPAFSRKVNCGGGALAGDWVADTGYSGGTARSTTAAIANATNAPQSVYQTRRYAPTLTYDFPDVPDGNYTIRLHFAELYYNAAGRRVFDVSIEGQARLTNFDIYQAAGGKNRAVVRTFENVVVSGGLQIQGVASADGAQFNGIEIESAGPAVPAVVASSSAITVPEGSTATFGVHLDTAPAGTVTVTVVRVSGDADITVSSGGSLVFTAANFAVDQTVTLAAAEDADTAAGTATIRCTASGYTAASVTAMEQDNDAPAFSRKVNCGGGALAGDWVADTGYSGGTARSTTAAIANATNAPPAVYQTRRNAPTLTYSFPDVPDGTYTIRLHFAELYCNAAGRRIFNVSIEGQTRLTNFDIYQAAGGKYRAVVRTFENVTVSGGLQILGEGSVDGAQFNGIEILSGAGARRSVAKASPMTAINWRGPDTVVSSEDAQTPGAGWAAVDGNLETFWRASGSWGSWICLGYTQPLAVRAVDVHFTPESPVEIFALASDDADNWFELEPELELGPVEANYLWFIFPPAPWAPPAAVREIELHEP